ncbi:MAG: FmdB family zinc ribbon protein [Terriglobia bacterium]
MPIFEYVCRACSHRFETLARGRHVPACPSCHSTALDQQPSVFAVGSPARRRSLSPAPSGCSTCGDPRGPGACSLT